MRHRLINQKTVDNHHSIVTVQLRPDNDAEKEAILNLQNLTASQVERDIVENYLHFSLELGDYSVIDALEQNNDIFILKIFT